MVDCGDPGNPYGGYRNIATDTKYQSIVTYTCKPDHHLEGEDSQVCQADGTWSGSKPVCLGMYFKLYSPPNLFWLLQRVSKIVHVRFGLNGGILSDEIIRHKL